MLSNQTEKVNIAKIEHGANFYDLRQNATYNSREVFFTDKPNEATREALKALKMRWNPKRGCWYGFVDDSKIRAAIEANAEPAQLGGTISEGYMGARRWDGCKSGEHLYGADLSKAIRAELKRQGIRGCSVSCKTFSGGQEVIVKVQPAEADYISLPDFQRSYDMSDCGAWLYDEAGEAHFHEAVWALPEEERRALLDSAALRMYKRITEKGEDLHNCRTHTGYKLFTADFEHKIDTINAVLDAYNYDNSNSMVDYFSTNFYQSIYLKPLPAFC